MKCESEYAVVYGDIVALYVFYWPLHQHFPESAQRTTGYSVLSEMTASLHAVASINHDCQSGVVAPGNTLALLVEVLTSMEVIKALLTLCRQMKWITQGTLAVLTAHISKISRSVTGWRLRLGEQGLAIPSNGDMGNSCA